MIRLLAAAIAALLLTSGAASAQSARSVIGAWEGHYVAQDGEHIPFELTFTSVEDGKLIGRSTEVECPRCAGYREHRAEWRGYVRDGAFFMSKIYDDPPSAGPAGWRHVVVYEGLVSPDGREITGRWHIGAAGQSFVMRRN